MRIRPAREAELAALTALVRASKAHWGYDQDFLIAAEDELRITQEDLTERTVRVAEHAGAVVGVSVLDLTGDDDAELTMLFVAPPAIGTGVGHALLEHAVAQARVTGVAGLLLESDPNAEPFYVAHGARRVGTRRSPSTGRALPLLRLPV